MRGNDRTGTRGEGNIRLIIGIVLVIVMSVALFKIVPLHIKAADVTDAMNEAANFGSLKPVDKLQYDVWDRAQQAGVPLDLKEVKVYKRGPNIVIEVKYTMKTKVFGYEYVYNFEKTVEKPVF